jgi:hypothetical protein
MFEMCKEMNCNTFIKTVLEVPGFENFQRISYPFKFGIALVYNNRTLNLSKPIIPKGQMWYY